MKWFGPRKPVSLSLRDAGLMNPPMKPGPEEPQGSPAHREPSHRNLSDRQPSHRNLSDREPSHRGLSDRNALLAGSREGLPRRFGDFLLTSRLGEDGLGRVYRALCLTEGGEFVRLRIFPPDRLAAEPLQREFARYVAEHPTLPSPHRARAERVGAVLDTAYLAWNETRGWTLGDLLEDLRRRGRRLPLEHILLIADGITKGLDSAGPHGLVWPGFVSISEDGEVRLGGFGLGESVLSSLDGRALSETLSPYIAPEALEEKRVGKNADVYSVGVILLELLTGFRTPFPGLGRGMGAEDLFPHELGRLLAVTLSRPGARFSGIADLRRELGQVVVSGRFLPSSFHFSRYLKELARAHEEPLKPEADGVEVRSGSDLPEEMPLLPALDEEEIEAVLQKFWGRIQA